MNSVNRPLRVLYSFPHRIGAERICATAWHQVDGLAGAQVSVTAMCGSFERPWTHSVSCIPTLMIGPLRVPYRLMGGRRAFGIHDYRVSKYLECHARSFDLVHVWPLGGRRTLRTAARLGIPSVLERPNAHTRFAYEVVQRECHRLGVELPKGHEHAYNEDVLRIEEAEYDLADALLCPSDFVLGTFVERGYSRTKLVRHQYGYDPSMYYPAAHREGSAGLNVIFAGGCAPRKGLHYALEAWLASPASNYGRFRIAGAFVPGYAERLAPMLAHRSVEVLGHRNDMAALMRTSDILVLPSIEEGSALVTSEARGSGCVLLVSDAAGAVCEHSQNALIHASGDVATLQEHFSLLHRDRALLERLREHSLRRVSQLTWNAAGARLLDAYLEVASAHGRQSTTVSSSVVAGDQNRKPSHPENGGSRIAEC